MITGIAFCAYAVSDMKKARAFYEGVLGLKPGKDYDGTNSENWIEYDIGASTLGVGCSPEWKPSPDGMSAALEVDDFDTFVALLKEKNVAFKDGPYDMPSCNMLVINDPDGNKVVIHHKKK